MNRKSNRESTVKRKLKYLKSLNGNFEEIANQILTCNWKAKVKSSGLDCLTQYANFPNVAYYGKADHIVTGDRHLLALGRFKKAKTVTVNEIPMPSDES